MNDDDNDETPRARALTPVTWTLLAMNVAVYLGMLSAGVPLLLTPVDALLSFGALSAREVWQGEIWRLLTAMFVHGGAWHLVLNMWVLVQIGRGLELALGSSRTLLIYLVTGVFGFSVSLLVHPGISAGASGAIFGVTGALLGLALRARGLSVGRSLFATLLPFVIGTLALGFLLPFVDNSAHLGGLILGVGLGFSLSVDVKINGIETDGQRDRRDQKIGGAALLLSLVVFAVVVSASARPTFSPKWAVVLGLDAVKRGVLDDANDKAARALELAPQDPDVLLFLARLKDAEQKDDADAFYREALKAFDADAIDQSMARAAAAMGRGDDPALFVIFDETMTAGLCRAALLPSQPKNAEVSNNCAWFMLNAENPRFRDVKTALALAGRAADMAFDGRAADALSGIEKETAAAYLHTLAVARAENGDVEEARITVERIVTQALSEQRFYVEELDRLTRDVRALGGPPPRNASRPDDAGATGTGPDAGAPSVHDDAHVDRAAGTASPEGDDGAATVAPAVKVLNNDGGTAHSLP